MVLHQEKLFRNIVSLLRKFGRQDHDGDEQQRTVTSWDGP